MTRRPDEPRRIARAAGLALSLLGLTVGAEAEPEIDADLVQRVTLGPARGASPMTGVNGARTRQANFVLPSSITVGWRARVTGPVTLEPVVDATGRIVVLHERGSLSQLDARGRQEWSLRLGDAAPSVGPALLSDGVRVVLNHDNRLLRISEEGRLLGSTATQLSGKAAPLLPLEDGGLVLAVEGALLRLDHQGRAIARAQLGQAVAGVLKTDSGVLAVSRAGSVYRFYGTGKLTHKGELGQHVGALAWSGSTLYAVTEARTLVGFDVASQTARVLYTTPPSASLANWIALGSHAIFVASSDGTLRGLGPSGKELLRSLVSDPQRGGTRQGALRASMPLALADRGRQLLVTQPGAESLLIERDGAHRRIAGSACLSPVSLTPLISRGVLLTCRNGELSALQESRKPGGANRASAGSVIQE